MTDFAEPRETKRQEPAPPEAPGEESGGGKTLKFPTAFTVLAIVLLVVGLAHRQRPARGRIAVQADVDMRHRQPRIESEDEATLGIGRAAGVG